MPEGSATLRVLVTTALGAYPVEGALVTVSTPADENGERTLLHAVVTDRSGLTPPLALATPARAQSLTPGQPKPFSEYTVEVVADGYTPVSALRIAMFDGQPALLPVLLTPESELGTQTEQTPFSITNTGDPQSLYPETP